MAKDTITRTDAQGNKVEVEVGIDGENPVSPNNPVSEKALLKTPTWDYPGEAVVEEESNEDSEDDNTQSPKKPAAKKSSSSRKK